MSRQATLIVGGYGGVGAALADALAEQEPKTLLLRSRRAQSAVTANSEGAEHALALDLRDTRQYADFAAAVKARLAAADATLTRLLIASGILQTAAQRPERGLRELDADAFHELMTVDALGPLLVVQALLPLLPRREASHIAVLSARVGSIGDNRLGGWYSYRCAKAALNQGFVTLSRELARSHKHCQVTLLHPGTVDTALAAPFRDSVPADSLQTPAQSAAHLLAVMQAREAAEPGIAYLDWAGKPIPW